MNLFKHIIYPIAISGLSLGLKQTPAIAFQLDLFSDAVDATQSVEVLGKNDSGFDIDSGISGTDLGRRRLDISLDNNSLISGKIQVFPSATLASISSDSLTTISSAKFTWGSDTTPAQDITTGGIDNSFRVNLLGIDQSVGATFTFTVEDSDGDVGVISDNISSIGSSYFPYDNLNANVNQESIREVSLEITNAPESFDATFDLIESAVLPVAVPFEFSPSVGLIFCGGLFGINRLKKKLRNN